LSRLHSRLFEKDSYGITVKNVTDGHAYAYVLNDGAEKQVTSSKAGKDHLSEV